MPTARTSSASSPRVRAVHARGLEFPDRVPDVLPARGDVTNPKCPTRHVLDHVLSRWGGLVLCALERGPTRFAALRRAVGGVSEKMLAQTLRGLARDGLVTRRVVPAVPPQVEYALTALGVEGAAHVRALVGWVEDRLPAFGDAWRRAERDGTDAPSGGRAAAS